MHENAYRLQGLPTGVPTTQNVQYLTLFRPSPSRFNTRPPQPVNTPEYNQGYPEWEVEIILAVRGTADRRSFLVKWADTPQRQWLSQACLTNCGELLQEFYERKNLPIPADIQELIDRDNENNQADDTESEPDAVPAS